MAKAEKSSKQAVKVKKKRWVEILSPTPTGNKPIGESHLVEPESAIGRVLSVNLMSLTGDVKSQSYSLKIEVSEYKENKLHTKLRGYYFSPSSIKRLIRRYVTRIDDSIVATTSDNVKVRIKPLLLTRGRTSKAVEKSLRSYLREEIIGFVRKSDFEGLFMSVVKFSLQKEIKDKLNKIYPIRIIEIRQLEKEKQDAKDTEIIKRKPAKRAKSKKGRKGSEDQHVEEEVQ